MDTIFLYGSIEMKSKRLFRGIAFVLIQAVICMSLAVLIAGLEIQLESVRRGPHYVNEFAAMPIVLALTFIGPISAALALPVHVYIHVKTSGHRAYWYCIAFSIMAIAGVWLFLHL